MMTLIKRISGLLLRRFLVVINAVLIEVVLDFFGIKDNFKKGDLQNYHL
jgi:hypothetical protein